MDPKRFREKKTQVDARLDVQFIPPVYPSKKGEGQFSALFVENKKVFSKLVLFMNAEISEEHANFASVWVQPVRYGLSGQRVAGTN